MLIDNELDELLNNSEDSSELNNQGHKRKSLGRGLGALLGEGDLMLDDSQNSAPASDNGTLISISEIHPGRFQPRTEFDNQALQSLADSVKEKGILQPLLVRKMEDGYELIAGERRWRAAQMAGLSEVPVIIKSFSDQEALEVALIENLLRENLSAIEEAEGFKRLIDEFSHTQEALSAVVGKSRSHVANTLRLLNLPQSVQQLVKDNKLSAGHARCLVGMENADELAQKIIAKDLNVRQVEDLVARCKEPTVAKPKKSKNEDLAQIEQDLVKSLGLRLKITPNKQGGGKVVLQYASVAELDMIVETLQQKRRNDSLQTQNTVFKAEGNTPSTDKFSIKIVD